jgi:hypothetical protein
MQLIRKFLLIFIVIFVQFAHAQFIRSGPGFGDTGRNSDIMILFVNGIMNSLPQTQDSSDVLVNALHSNGLAKGLYAYSYFYNPTNYVGGIADFPELRLQATISDTHLRLTQRDKARYYNSMGIYYNDNYNAIKNGTFTGTETLKRIVEISGQLKERLNTITSIRPGVIVVPHSQGNFLIEAAYAMLVADRSINTLNKIRVVGIASVAATTPFDRYITSANDRAIIGQSSSTHDPSLINGNLNLLTYDTLTATETPCMDQFCGDDISWSSIDSTGHGFREVYLNSSIKNYSNTKSFPAIISEMIRISYQELNPSTPLTVLSALQAGTYDYSTDMQCYYKNILGSSVGANEYAMSETKYCLNSAQNAWVLTVDDAGQLLLPNGSWVNGNNPSIAITGNTTFTANYGGYAFQNGTLTQNTVGSNYPSGSTSAGISTVDTRDRYIIWTGSSNIYMYSSTANLNALITNWNASNNGQATLSRTNKYGWSFVTPQQNVTDYTAGIYKLYDISLPSTCTTTGTGSNAITTCGRPILSTGTWTKNTLFDGSAAIELNVNSQYTDLLLFGETGERALYVKRPSENGVREGVRRLSGKTRSFNAVNRTYMNADLAARGYPTTVN